MASALLLLVPGAVEIVQETASLKAMKTIGAIIVRRPFLPQQMHRNAMSFKVTSHKKAAV